MIVQLQLQAQARLSVLFAPLCIFSAVSLTPAAAAATNMPCDPESCVVAKFDFQVAELECSSCTPESSRWRCPARNNVYGPAFEATFDEKGFGDWTLQQCIYKEYEPGFLAFAGPGAYADYFVTACPSAVYCACGDVKTKIKKLMGPTPSQDQREATPDYWASLAPGFTLAQNFTSVTGGSYENFELVYTHSDGRRQFCSGIQSYTYSPQYPDSWVHTPNAYTTDCSIFPASCDEMYAETASTSCGLLSSTRTCTPVGGGGALEVATTMPTIVGAASVAPAWGDEPDFGVCSAACGGGTQAGSEALCFAGSGPEQAGQYCDRDQEPTFETTTQPCNTRECSAATGGASAAELSACGAPLLLVAAALLASGAL